jgi:hypothetical protein
VGIIIKLLKNFTLAMVVNLAAVAQSKHDFLPLHFGLVAVSFTYHLRYFSMVSASVIYLYLLVACCGTETLNVIEESSFYFLVKKFLNLFKTQIFLASFQF